jgi:hypothetical protein
LNAGQPVCASVVNPNDGMAAAANFLYYKKKRNRVRTGFAGRSFVSMLNFPDEGLAASVVDWQKIMIAQTYIATADYIYRRRVRNMALGRTYIHP